MKKGKWRRKEIKIQGRCGKNEINEGKEGWKENKGRQSGRKVDKEERREGDRRGGREYIKTKREKRK